MGKKFKLNCNIKLSLKGKFHGNLVLYQKIQNRFSINRNLSVLLKSPQCTQTIDECLWQQMDWVRMDYNLKNV